MTTPRTPTSSAAIQRYKIGYHADEWGQRSSTPSGIPDASGSWVRYADHVTALAAGQAAAAQAVAEPVAWMAGGTSTAADGKTELFNLPGYPLMVRAVDFNRIHAESEMRRAALLDEMQKAAPTQGATEMENLQRTAVGWQGRALRAERNWAVCRRWAIAGGAPVEKLGDDPDQPFHAASPAIEGESKWWPCPVAAPVPADGESNE